MLFVLLWQWLLVACIAWPVLSHEIRSFDEIHLITQYFHAVDRTRHEEYDYALCKNIANPFITSIHLLQSSKLASGEVFDEELFDICKPEWGIPRAAFNKVKLVHDDPSISERLKFSEAVSYALRNLPRELVIITDSDIYFDDSVQNLTNNPYVYYELAMLKRNYYLSRYEQVENSNFGTQCGPKFRGIHDAFVFSPSDAYNFLPDLTAFTFGTWGLANRVIYELQQQALYTKNPCELVKPWHSHASEVKGQRIPFVGRGGSAAVRPSGLFDEIQYTNGGERPTGGLVIPRSEPVIVYV